MGHPHVFFFGALAGDNYLLPYERDLLANCRILRNFINNIIETRRSQLVSEPGTADAGDFLTTLLTEPHFKDNNSRIIDECLTFFFAGS